MIKKGTIIVRTDGRYDSFTHLVPEGYPHIGTMYQVVKSHKYNSYYKEDCSQSCITFRLATPKEIEAFNNGIRHVDMMDAWENKKLSEANLMFPKTPDDSYQLPKHWYIERNEDNYKEVNDYFNTIDLPCTTVYTKLSGIIGVAHSGNRSWEGSRNQTMKCATEITTEQFRKFINNKNNTNETIKKITERPVSNGQCIKKAPSGTRRITTASRLIGNKTSAKCQRTIIGSTKRCGQVISC